MKINAEISIQGQVCCLVPYKRHHVAKYHQWMQDPKIQELTESEPLSLDEEYQMQQTWYHDEDKCTWIILDRSANSQQDSSIEQEVRDMAGDVNLFLNDPDERQTAEIEVMVAEVGSRRKGIAKEAVHLMMAYAAQHLGITRFRAKILEDNTPSIALFQQLGFVVAKRVAVFKEVHMELDAAEGTSPHAALSRSRLGISTYNHAPA